jgi:hypothetical protein
LGRVWIPIAGFLVALNIVIMVIGLTHPGLIGYGGPTARIVGLSVIPVGLASFFFARYVQQGVRGEELWRTAGGSDAIAVQAEG